VEGELVSVSVSIVWFRQDLRLSDNLALLEAVANSDKVVPVFIWAPDEEKHWAPGGASRWWLHQSLEKLNEDVESCGSKLIIRTGKSSLKVLREVIEETNATTVYFNKRYDTIGRAIDTDVEKGLEHDGVECESFNSSLLHEPEKVRTKSGGPFKVFTPFWNHFMLTIEPQLPAGRPKSITSPTKVKTERLTSLELEPKIDWASGFSDYFVPGEKGAHAQLKKFLRDGVRQYQTGRDRPDHDGVSMLSPHLHFGEISPRQIWHRVRELEYKPTERKHVETYLKEIGWREFAHHILFHFPDTSDKPLREQFERFPWSYNAKLLKKWQKGKTGYPIVDAGMRQLWHTGWMHNRVRMIVASFLTKDLLLSWNQGAEWFWDTLVDADLPNNTLGWQWAAGCGADAAPYFRIFNPELQGEKFDPDGEYVRQWVPELAKLPSKWIHKPDKAPPLVLHAAGIELGKDYPKPVVDHSAARKRALEALKSVKIDVEETEPARR